MAAGEHWLALWATTNDDPGRTITLAAGPVIVAEDGAGLATEPEPPEETFYTAAQSDARYAQKTLNLSDLADAASARANLSVLSRTEVENKFKRDNAVFVDGTCGDDGTGARERADLPFATIGAAVAAAQAGDVVVARPGSYSGCELKDGVDLHLMAGAAVTTEFYTPNASGSCAITGDGQIVSASGAGLDAAQTGVSFSVTVSVPVASSDDFAISLGGSNTVLCRGCTIESAASGKAAVSKSGGTLVLEDCRVFGESSASYSITAGSAQTVTVRGALAVNKPLHGNITISGESSTPDLAHEGSKIGFYGTTPITRQTVTGATVNDALNSLLTALDSLGLITDSTTF